MADVLPAEEIRRANETVWAAESNRIADAGERRKRHACRNCRSRLMRMSRTKKE